MSDADRALDEIRRTELQAARIVEAAREKAAEIVDAAGARSRELVEEGRRRGQDRARHVFEDSKAEIQAEARRVREQGVADAENLIRSADEKTGELVDELVAVVLAPPRERGK